MNTHKLLIGLLFLVLTLDISGQTPVMKDSLFIRIAEIEIVPEYLDAYNAILKEESATSVKAEPGVIAIFPMYLLDSPNQVRILEIYASKAAYQAHLQAPHFQHYKTTTLKMVKALKLVEMKAIDKDRMGEVFKKLN